MGTGGGGVFRSAKPTTEINTVGLTSPALPYTQNYPNPFSESTNISFTIPERTYASLKVYDALGNQLALLAGKVFDPGKYEVTFDGSSYPSGTYFYQLETEGGRQTKGLVLLH